MELVTQDYAILERWQSKIAIWDMQPVCAIWASGPADVLQETTASSGHPQHQS